MKLVDSDTRYFEQGTGTVQVVVDISYDSCFVDYEPDTPFTVSIRRWAPCSPNHGPCPCCKQRIKNKEVFKYRLYRATEDEVIKLANVLHERVSGLLERGYIRPMLGSFGIHYLYSRQTDLPSRLEVIEV
jgi:hypothetical protein